MDGRATANGHRVAPRMRRFDRRALLRVAGGFAGGAILAACGEEAAVPQPTAAPSGATRVPGSANPTGGTNPTSAPVAAAPPKGGTLVVANTSDPEILDPHITTNIIAGYALTLIHDTLITRDYDGSFKPSLAEKYEISPDGKTYTFTLKKGVTFHSGKNLTAADVKYSFERWKGIEKAPNAYTIQPIDSIETPDPQTVRFLMKTPYNIFLDQLAGVWAVILNKDAVDKAGKDYGVTTADGTGPYTFVSWTRNQKLVLARHEAYRWGSAIFGNTGPAHLDGVEFRVIPEDTTRVAEFQTGSVHIMTQVPGAEVERLGKTPKVAVVQYPQLSTIYMGINTKKAPFDDLKVRQAINHAVNKEEIVRGAIFGLGTPAQTMMAPATPNYAKGIEATAPMFDQKKAAALLDEAGWKPGAGGIREKDGKQLVMPLWVFNETLWTLISQIMEQQLGKVGIKVETKTYEGAAMFAALRGGEHVAYVLDFYYENPDSVFYFYFYSKQQPSPNRFAYNVPEVDKLLEDSRTNPDRAVVTQAYETIQKRILADAPSVPLYHSLGTVGKADAVQGVKMHPSRWLYKMMDLSLKK